MAAAAGAPEPGLDRSTFLAASPDAMGSAPDSAVDAPMHRLEQGPVLRQRLEDGTDEDLIALTDQPGPA